MFMKQLLVALQHSLFRLCHPAVFGVVGNISATRFAAAGRLRAGATPYQPAQANRAAAFTTALSRWTEIQIGVMSSDD
jgi:hypothetical protein